MYFSKPFFGVLGAVSKSAASAAAPGSAKFQAMIKLAASEASMNTKNRGPSSRGALVGGSACRRRGSGLR